MDKPRSVGLSSIWRLSLQRNWLWLKWMNVCQADDGSGRVGGVKWADAGNIGHNKSACSSLYNNISSIFYG